MINFSLFMRHNEKTYFQTDHLSQEYHVCVCILCRPGVCSQSQVVSVNYKASLRMKRWIKQLKEKFSITINRKQKSKFICENIIGIVFDLVMCCISL